MPRAQEKQAGNPQLQRVIARLEHGIEEMRLNVQELRELLGQQDVQTVQADNEEEDESDEEEEETEDEDHEPGGQGRVKDPSHDRRLKQNRGRQA